MPVLDRVDCRRRNINRYKKGQISYYLVSVRQIYKIILNVYAVTVLKYVKHILTKLKGERDTSTIIDEDFNTLSYNHQQNK